MAPWDGHDNGFKILHHCTQSCLYTTHAYSDDYQLGNFHLVYIPAYSVANPLPRPIFKAETVQETTRPAGVAIYDGDARVQGCIKDPDKLRMTTRHMIDPF
jgi:hypothetical protein